MDGISSWRLCDEFTIVQAALLIAGHDPSSNQYYVESWDADKRPAGYEGAKAALLNAIQTEKLRAKIVYSKEIVQKSVYEGDEYYSNITVANDLDYPDISKTVIDIQDLGRFLKDRGIRDGFFSEIDRLKTVTMDVTSQHYAPKLAAAIRAWTEVSSRPELLRGKTPKQALEKWLREHAGEFGLTNRDGNPNQQGIEEICKVANWKPEGGATPTPGKKAQGSPVTNLPPKVAVKNFDLDDEIPF
jgi:hypothetical protein